MSKCLTCSRPAQFREASSNPRFFCGKECQLALIEGKKRPRTTGEEIPIDSLEMKVFHTLKQTPEMLENLANVFTEEQLRSLKYNKMFHESLWKNSNFWYYVVKRFRPNLAPGPFDITVPYKKIAMKNIIAPDMTIWTPGELDPRLRQVLLIVMRNPEALDTLIQNVSLAEIQGWTRVSVDFNQIVANSNVFWYKLWQRYGKDTGEEYNYTVNYRTRLSEERPNLFEPVLKIYVNGNLFEITLIDIHRAGSLQGAVESINVVTGADDRDFVELWWYFEGDDSNSNLFEDYVDSIWSALEGSGVEQSIANGEVVVFYYDFKVVSPVPITVSLSYPADEIVPYFYDMQKRTWVDSLFEPRVGRKKEEVIQQTVYRFTGPDYESRNEGQPDVRLPAYFTLRGDSRPLDLDSWGEILVNGEIVPFERLEQAVGAYIEERQSVEIKMRPF